MTTPDQSVVWLDGELLRAADARVSPFDHGLLVGDGVFETTKVVAGVPFALRRHLARLRRSAGGLRITVPFTDEELSEAITAVIAANGPGTGRLRTTVTGGPGPLGSDRGTVLPTVLIAASAATVWPPSTAVVTVPWPRNERSAVAGLKTVSYAENVVALTYAHERGASEAVFPNTTGLLCEGTGSNVFLVHEGRLVTPTLAAGCLGGITRELVLETSDAVECDVPLEALAGAAEAFLTSSTRDVQPISRVDGRALPTCPGPHTERAAAALAALSARTLDP
ncbi:MAG: aminotransferase class IV [Acidimicrobiales bacterium]|nr:aminotransferase class IV [Acidimicrobiales bacterium]